jgi:hypothetical protein
MIPTLGVPRNAAELCKTTLATLEFPRVVDHAAVVVVWNCFWIELPGNNCIGRE